jgi:hypothetical protein
MRRPGAPVQGPVVGRLASRARLTASSFSSRCSHAAQPPLPDLLPAAAVKARAPLPARRRPLPAGRPTLARAVARPAAAPQARSAPSPPRPEKTASAGKRRGEVGKSRRADGQERLEGGHGSQEGQPAPGKTSGKSAHGCSARERQPARSVHPGQRRRPRPPPEPVSAPPRRGPGGAGVIAPARLRTQRGCGSALVMSSRLVNPAVHPPATADAGSSRLLARAPPPPAHRTAAGGSHQ